MELQAADLQERGDMVNELMMEKGELLAGIAAQGSAKEEQSTLAGGEKNEGKVDDVQPPDDVEDYAQSVAKQIEENSILCVRCGRSLDHLEEITKEQANERNKRVRCLGYRMLLPPLPHGVRPAPRSHAWAQACMRAMLVAKAMHNRLTAEEQLCSRFPEFVHAWFAKQPVIELTQKERNRLLVMAQQGVKEEEEKVHEDDENRWAFYAKIKELAALGSTEANLFWLLLDETHGGDYLVFFLHCLMAILSVAGPTLHGQLGITARGLTRVPPPSPKSRVRGEDSRYTQVPPDGDDRGRGRRRALQVGRHREPGDADPRPRRLHPRHGQRLRLPRAGVRRPESFFSSPSLRSMLFGRILGPVLITTQDLDV
jgi:hypothetical protein